MKTKRNTSSLFENILLNGSERIKSACRLSAQINIPFPRPSHMHAPCFCGFHAGFGAFGDLFAFEFGEDGELTENHAPDGGSCVDALGDDVEVDAALLQVIQERQ